MAARGGDLRGVAQHDHEIAVERRLHLADAIGVDVRETRTKRAGSSRASRLANLAQETIARSAVHLDVVAVRNELGVRLALR